MATAGHLEVIRVTSEEGANRLLEQAGALHGHYKADTRSGDQHYSARWVLSM
jgi:hypothetical protein